MTDREGQEVGEIRNPQLDPDLVGRYTLTTWNYKQGEMVALMIHLGVQLGIYEALDGSGWCTPADLAQGNRATRTLVV